MLHACSGVCIQSASDESDIVYAFMVLCLQEWNAEEIAQGLHNGSMKFAMESRSQRGVRNGIPATIGQLSEKAIAATAGMPNNDASTHGAVKVTMDKPTLKA